MNDEWKRYLTMAGSGALTGGTMGGIGKILGGSRSIAQILRSTGLGAAAGGTAIPAAAGLGEIVLGSPKNSELQPYTTRSAVGGALVGGGLGALGGYLSTAPLGQQLADFSPKLTQSIKKSLPLNNILYDTVKKIGPRKGALLGALLGAGGLGFLAGDEGQQYDTIRNLTDLE